MTHAGTGPGAGSVALWDTAWARMDCGEHVRLLLWTGRVSAETPETTQASFHSLAHPCAPAGAIWVTCDKLCAVTSPSQALLLGGRSRNRDRSPEGGLEAPQLLHTDGRALDSSLREVTQS